MKRYVYRGPAEPPARATASGNQNVVAALHGMGVMAPMTTYPPTPAPWLQDRPPMACPAWGCSGPGSNMGPVVQMPYREPFFWPFSGATSAVPQPPPTTGVSLTVPAPPASTTPAPSPTVAVDASQTAPSLTDPGQTLAQQTGTPWDLGTWLGESTIFSSLPNWAVAGGGLLALFMFMGGGKRR